MSGLRLTGGPLKEYYYFKDTILEKVCRGENNFMVLLPVNRAVRHFSRLLIDHTPAKALLAPPVFTFDRLLLKIYKEQLNPKIVIERDLIRLIIAHILDKHRQKWTYFSFSKKIAQGYFKRISDIIFELRRFGFTADSMTNALPRLDQENDAKIEDLFQIQKLLEEILDPDLIDEFGAVNNATASLDRQQFEETFPHIDELYISGYGLFTPAMYEFIEKVSSWKDVSIKLEHVQNNPDLFNHTSSAVERMANYKETKSTVFAQYLFNRSAENLNRLSPDKAIQICGFDDRNREVAYIAEKIRILHLEHSVPLNQIGVTFADLETYAPVLRQIFKDYEIPFNLSTGFRLVQSPLVRTFLEILNIKTSGFDAEILFRLLRSPLINGPPEFDVFRFQSYLNSKRIRHFPKSQITSILHAYAAEHPDDDQAEKFIPFLSASLKPLYELPDKLSVEEFRSHSMSLFSHFGILEWYKKENAHLNQRQKEVEFRAFNRFMKLFDRSLWLLERLYSGEKLNYSQFVEFLTSALREAVFNVTEWPGYGVQIMPRLELQAAEPQYLFIGGLVDGEFPRTSARDVFFRDESRLSLGLITSDSLHDQDRFLFYNFLDSNAREIYLSYPKYRGERTLIPSAFIKELSERFECNVIEDPGVLFRNSSQTRLDFGYALQKMDLESARQSVLQIVSTQGYGKQELVSVLNRIAGTFQRRSGSTFGPNEGFLESQDIIQSLLKKYDDHIWSISQIEDYATCPMAFFLKRIMGIDEDPDYPEILNSLEKGNLVHKILYDYFRAVKKNSSSDNHQNNSELIKKIAERHFQSLPFKGLFWELEKQIYLGTEDQAGLLEMIIEVNNEYQQLSEMAPSYFEYGFGHTALDAADDSSTKRPVVLKHGDKSI